MNTWDSSIAVEGCRLDVVEPSQHVIVGLDGDHAAELPLVATKVSRLLKLICTLPQRVFDGDLRAMASAVGIDSNAAATMLAFPETLSANVFARADVFSVAGEWRALEINIGSLVGGQPRASLPRLCGFEQDGDVLRNWAASTIKRWSMENGYTVFVADESLVDEIRRPLSIYADEFAAQLGRDVPIVGPRSLKWDGCHLLHEGQCVDFVYCRFNEGSVLSAPDDYADLISATNAGAVCCPMALAYNAIGNKGVWALLWTMCDHGLLAADEAELVTTFLPRTVWLDERSLDAVLANQQRLVLKPVCGLEGRDVRLGNEATVKQWQTLVRAAATQARSYVAQELVSPDVMTVSVADTSGNTHDEAAHVVWGVYVFGDNYLGCFLRGSPLGSSMVINVATGSSSGPVPPLRMDTNSDPLSQASNSPSTKPATTAETTAR
ncbi:circularly permuted type 2 ATP-grasp protein [Burkholderia contaminans]|uniref:circularly permuted type 2 ATP-grasp protein n=1 Tax=Burkholderia contaminans TaxID=488447 RepID=UPI001452D26D|nr:circularly permuted type 2 ATP-grasp protein [Burkholderia contaminans]MCA8157817.1 circularly permuted type 2 ATP-grasp protein [Burkholderia contaminans]VWD59922.1 hypothetical protein BCO19218_07160 [Burkholderia contaminans]